MSDLPENKGHLSLDEQLAAEEPPMGSDDTAPRKAGSTQPRPAVQIPPDSWRRYLGGTILMAAFLLTIAAGLLIFWDQDNPTPQPQEPTVVVRQQTPSAEPTRLPATPTPDAISSILVLPTAAVDVEAIALMTPAADTNPVEGIVQRPNLPITVGNPAAVERGMSMYRVKTGDTVQGIADKFGLKLCTLVWSNDRNNVSPLRTGIDLIIPPVDGVYARIEAPLTIAQLAQTTKVEPYDIIDSQYNPILFDAAPESWLPEGTQVMVPNGDGGDCNIWVAPVRTASTSGSGGTVSSYDLWGCNTEIHTTGFPAGHPIPSGRYTFFRGFSAGHPAVDLSGTVGEPIQATGNGTVVFAGTSQYGYGNVVVIGHGSHFTLYAHLNNYNVRCGQAVSAGMVIGTLGNTGNSTGPHLHYEIRNADFQALDPCYTIRC